MKPSVYITGVMGDVISEEERRLFSEKPPWGLILFQRNCISPQQIKNLTKSFRDIVGRVDAPIFIDQEGGRVQRLKPPKWRCYPSASVYGAIYNQDEEAGRRAAWLGARLIADDLYQLGINCCCLPLLDIPISNADEIIGDRAYGTSVDIVSILAKEVAEGLMAGGVLPVCKHIPGHGRALIDSHLDLPVVDSKISLLQTTDFLPFAHLNHYPMAMTAHIVYSDIDKYQPATLSPTVIENVIRKEIGFNGLLMSDDISMKALQGEVGQLANQAIDAGCDMILHCNGVIEEMAAIADQVPSLTGISLQRAEMVIAALQTPEAMNRQEFENEYDVLTTDHS